MEAPISSLPPQFLPIDTPPGPDVDLSANQGPRVVGICIFLMVVSGLIVFLRFTARYLSTAGIWWDDWLCLAAMIVAWGCCCCGFVVTQHNFGRHEATVPVLEAMEDTVIFFKALYAYQTMYTIAITLAKASIMVFYGRIFTERAFRIALWIVAILVGAWFVAVQIIQLLECRPLHALWDGTYAENCIDLVHFFIVVGAINCVFNFILLVMPLPMIWRLEIGQRAKIGLTVTFMMGAFVFGVSVARLGVFQHLTNIDVTWSYVDSAIWTTVEPVVAVCSASLPILRSLWVILRPNSSATNSMRDHSYRGRHGDKQVNFVETPRIVMERLNSEDDQRKEVPRSAAWSESDMDTPRRFPSPRFETSTEKEVHGGYPSKGLHTIEVSRLGGDRSPNFSPISEHTEPPSELLAPSPGRNPNRGSTYGDNVNRTRSVVSRYSPVSSSKAFRADNQSSTPHTNHSDNPSTLEMHRLPIQGEPLLRDVQGSEHTASIQESWGPQSRDGAETHSRQSSSSWAGPYTQTWSTRPSSSHASKDYTTGQFGGVSGNSARGSSMAMPAFELDVRSDRRFSLKRPKSRYRDAVGGMI